MPFNFGKEGYELGFNSLFNVLENKQISYSFPHHQLNSNVEVEGILVGGNLSVLYSMLGSNSMPDLSGKLLFLEDLDEYKYHIDRMMLGLKRAGILEKLNGILVGGFTSMRDNTIPFGMEAEEIIANYAKTFCIPVFFNVPAGHIPGNNALIIGGKTKVVVKGELCLSYLNVE
jgi:muramoyltetrapeptide carboxypeptidase